MRYYTILLNDEEKVAASLDGKTLYVLDEYKDMNELLDAGEPVETRCQFCGKTYVFGTDELRAAREEAKKSKKGKKE